jgi:hypothetical protein
MVNGVCSSCRAAAPGCGGLRPPGRAGRVRMLPRLQAVQRGLLCIDTTVAAVAAQPVLTVAPRRPPPSQRRFVSQVVESVVEEMGGRLADPQLGVLLGNTLPNTLDTTVYVHDDTPGKEDTFIITGDINAMWLRDSTNQVNPYVDLAADDPALRALLCGLIRRQTACVLLDVYANAFNVDTASRSYESSDVSTKPSFLGTRVDALSDAIWERKWELDSVRVHALTS